MRTSLVLAALSLIGLARSVFAQEQPASEWVAAALENPTDEQTVFHAIAALRQNPSPNVIASSRELFTKLTSKSVRQMLALVLIQAQQTDGLYFDELAKYARAAIAASAPPMFQFDEDGNELKDHIRPEFVAWCESNRLELGVCGQTVGLYALDVLLLAEAKDARALQLLRQGLSAADPGVVWCVAQGLGWLGNTASIPMIVASLQRFPPKVRELVASALAEFDDPRIGPLLDRFVPDPEWRKELDVKIRKRHQL
jgi:HEAT repeat protein